jgi:Ulp1 family protease
VLNYEINTYNALDSLKECNYLNDEVINFMLNIFVKVLPTNDEMTQCDNFVVLNTFLYPQLVKPEHYDDEKIKRFLKKKVKPSTQFLIIPINLEDCKHWSLAIIANLNLSLKEGETVLDHDKTSILYLDSLLTIQPKTH